MQYPLVGFKETKLGAMTLNKPDNNNVTPISLRTSPSNVPMSSSVSSTATIMTIPSRMCGSRTGGRPSLGALIWRNLRTTNFIWISCIVFLSCWPDSTSPSSPKLMAVSEGLPLMSSPCFLLPLELKTRTSGSMRLLEGSFLSSVALTD